MYDVYRQGLINIQRRKFQQLSTPLKYFPEKFQNFPVLRTEYEVDAKNYALLQLAVVKFITGIYCL